MLSDLELENPEQAAAQLERIYSTSRELTRSMDEIVWAVNPQHDTLDSLASYLGNFAQEYVGSLGVRCRLEVPLHLPHWPITAETRHNIFLAFKEALHNVVKHSGVQSAVVKVTQTPDELCVVVEDRGVGFEWQLSLFEPRPEGFGLWSVADRVRDAAGEMTVDTGPGRGCRVTVVFPLRKTYRGVQAADPDADLSDGTARSAS